MNKILLKQIKINSLKGTKRREKRKDVSKEISESITHGVVNFSRERVLEVIIL